MTPEEMTELNKKFLSEEFDFEKIADIAVKHYLNSDIYKSKKKDLDELKQSKVVDMNTSIIKITENKGEPQCQK